MVVISEYERSEEGEMEINHFSHEHPLVFIVSQHDHKSFATEDDGVTETIKCFGCDQSLDDDGSSYGCKECKYYLHKRCAELELATQINHPFHPQHLLTLLPKPPYKGKYRCDFCARASSGFVYHCDVCEFDLHINCALLQSSIAPEFPISVHQHPLLFVQNHNQEVLHYCSACEKSLSGPIYHCSDCSYPRLFNLHKECADIELAPQIHHPFHPQHLLTLLPKSLYTTNAFDCNLCGNHSRGFVYRCYPCRFELHVDCALLQSSIAPNFPISLHQHPLFFLPNHDQQIKRDCSGCEKPLSGPVYHCSVCYHRPKFSLHKECGELPLEIYHSYDRKHPLTLLPSPPSHPENCGCGLCKIQWKGFVYSCSLCKFDLTPEDVSAPRTIEKASHEHPWMLLSRKMSFTCDFCGTSGDRTPYLCVTCDLLVHRNCVSLPRKILITRHHHVISHSYSLRQNNLEERPCRICYEELDTGYGSYSCFKHDCNYIAHPLCATDESVWDGTIIAEDYDESSMEALLRPSNLITVVSEQRGDGEEMVAIEIKHAYHDHNLRPVFSGEIKDDCSQCDGCMGRISTPFYCCEQCKFCLHKDCAELPKGKRHPFHKHLLMLSNITSGSSGCSACNHFYQGFSYECNIKGCNPRFTCDIRCILLSDTLEHPSHEHSLFLVHNFRANCSGCLREICSSDVGDMAYRCKKRCDFNFVLDLRCATRPLTAWFKYDMHPLTLAYSDDSSPSQHFCDLCENERDPKDWFYYCSDCDNSLHLKCALGYPFRKLGSRHTYNFHPHPLTLVIYIWNCPPCSLCDNLCNGPGPRMYRF